MLRRPAPATLISLVALFFSMSGAAFAAKHYMLNSTSQINPKVLKALKGKRGPRGTQVRPGQLERAEPKARVEQQERPVRQGAPSATRTCSSLPEA